MTRSGDGAMNKFYTKKIKHCLSAKASRVSMQTDKQDGKCLTESSNKVVLAYERVQSRK